MVKARGFWIVALILAWVSPPLSSYAATSPTHSHLQTHDSDSDQLLAKRRKKNKRRKRRSHKRRSRRKSKARKKSQAAQEQSTEGSTTSAEDAQTTTAILPPPPVLPRKTKAVALFPVFGAGLPQTLAHQLVGEIIEEVDALKEYTSVSPADVAREVEGLGLSVTCKGQLSCLAQTGRYARSHVALELRLASIGGSLNALMLAVDTQQKQEIGRAATILSEDDDTRSRELYRLILQALTPKAYVGALKVLAGDGAEVYLDDKLIGRAPIEKPVRGIPAGPHILRVSKLGYRSLYQFVTIEYRQTSTVQIDLESNSVSAAIDEPETGTGRILLLAATDGVQIRIDGEPFAYTPLQDAIPFVPAGKHTVTLRYPGSDETVSFDVMVERDKRLELAVTEAGGTPRLAGQRQRNYNDPLPKSQEELLLAVEGRSDSPLATAGDSELGWPFYAGWGAAAVGVAATTYGVITLLDARALKREQRDIAYEARDGVTYERLVILDAERAAKAEEAKSTGRKGTIAVGIGAAAFTAATYLLWNWLFGEDVPQQEAPPEQAPSP